MEKNNVIYLAGAIRGDPSYREYFKVIIKIVENYAESRTELSDKYVPSIPYLIDEKYKQKIYERDLEWIKQSKAIIAETSGASTGVGYEIAYAIHERNIPVLCLYHEKSVPSLMIIQNINKYIFGQKYSNEKDLEFYIKTFLYIITKFSSIDERKTAYNKILKNIRLKDIDLEQLETVIEDFLLNNIEEYYEKRFKPLTIEKYKQIEFSDAQILIDFMLKSIILQNRWINLKSQRLGETFISGRKNQIIKFLSKYNIGDISTIYEDIERSEVDYTEWAFKKNLRAYRLIGLINSIYNIKYGSTKLKDNIYLQETLLDSIKLKSITSKRFITESSFYTTMYLIPLSNYLKRFGNDFLINLLKESMTQKWFQKIEENKIDDIDKIDIEKLLIENWAIQAINYLKIKSKEFYATTYSSYYKRFKPHELIIKISKISEM